MLGAHFFLVPLVGRRVVYVQVGHVNDELERVELARVLNPLAFLALDVFKKFRASGF